MELFRAGEALLKPPLLLFVAPTTYKLPQISKATAVPLAKQYRGIARECRASRSFATTHARREQPVTEKQRSAPSQNFPSTSPASQSSMTDELTSLMDSALDFKKAVPAAPTSRTSRLSSRNAQASNPPSRDQVNELNATKSSSGNAIDNIINHLDLGRKNQPQRMDRSERDISQAVDPLGFLRRQTNRFHDIDDRTLVKLGPKVGRTVEVNNARNMDVGRAFRTLEIQCARNSVRRDFNKQRFHERPGLKRKRLKSERWRKNFKNQFRATVRMVQQMKRQGW